MKIAKKLILLGLFITSTICFSQKKEMSKVVIDDLLNETQKSNDEIDGIEMLWWMPAEYWEAVLSRDPSTSDAETKQIIDLLKKYALMIVVKGDVGMFGGITYKSREDILKELNLYYNGSKLKLISDDDLEPDLKNFITIIGPMMKNMLGQMGENMQVFTFQNDGGKPIDVWNTGNFDMELGNFKPRVELPLGALLLEKKCPEGEKLFNGKWSFCPHHGKKLVEQ